MATRESRSNAWSTWSHHVLLELERLAEKMVRQDNEMVQLRTRVTRLEERLSVQSKALGCIGIAALSSLGAIVVWFVQNWLSN